jgi:hypothetical protein
MQFIRRHAGKLCSSVVQQQQQKQKQPYSSSGLCALSFCSPSALFEREYPSRWIGKGGPTAWTPRSPYLTPSDYFLWGDVKDHMQSRRVNTLDELRAGITAKTANVTKDTVQRVWQEVKCVWEVYRVTDGAHCEVIRT